MWRRALFLAFLFACSSEGSGSQDASTADTTSGDVGVRDTGPADGAGDTADLDSGASDGGASDSGASDSGASDSGASDSGASDGGASDSGTDAGDLDGGGSDSSTDAGASDSPAPVDHCAVPADMEVGRCEERALPGDFVAEVQWTWPGAGDEVYSVVTPLVANLTDDDGNGAVDLCDTPDVVVVMARDFTAPGHIYVLDGATGALHFQVPTAVNATVTPALGDIDGDGLVEIVSIDPINRLVAFDGDGTLKWTAAGPWGGPGTNTFGEAIALADVDNDGDVEIAVGNSLADHLGANLWVVGERPPYSATTLADLDGDGDLEVVVGHSAYHHDGTVLFRNAAVEPGFPQVADLDRDGFPEVLVSNGEGISLLEHDGALIYGPIAPTGVPTTTDNWNRPAAIHDFDGDAQAEYALSSLNRFAVYESGGTIVWSATVSDSGIASATGFDFFGDGSANAVYADEHQVFVFDEVGRAPVEMPRSSFTLSEYPVVADVDNDGSAEIIVVSSLASASPAVQVIRSTGDRWVQARRIWNQHTYHVTNVREDGTIPRMEAPSHLGLNTFRANAQIEGGAVCDPNL